MSQTLQTHHIYIDPVVSSMFPILILSLEKQELYQIALLTSSQLLRVASSAPHTSPVWPSPSFALLLSYLRPSSFLTWTTARAPHGSPFLQCHLLTSILFTTSREDFLTCMPDRSTIQLVISSAHGLFLIYPIKAQHFSITFIVWPLPVPRATSPTIHASCSIPKLYNFLWTRQNYSCLCALVC